ncbi:hypothetical protein WH47_10165, partial [Habropoda laboriosa]
IFIAPRAAKHTSSSFGAPLEKPVCSASNFACFDLTRERERGGSRRILAAFVAILYEEDANPRARSLPSETQRNLVGRILAKSSSPFFLFWRVKSSREEPTSFLCVCFEKERVLFLLFPLPLYLSFSRSLSSSCVHSKLAGRCAGSEERGNAFVSGRLMVRDPRLSYHADSSLVNDYDNSTASSGDA